MDKDKLVGLHEALLELLKLCHKKENGSMYMYTSEGHGVVFSLENGEIIDVFFRNTRGIKALPLIKEITQTKYFFKKDNKNAAAATKVSEPMPGKEAIFMQLGMDYHEEASKLGPARGTAKKVLAVDDSGIARKAIVQTLLSKGYDVVEAKDGYEAMSQLRDEKPDLVLLDLILPKMDGYEVLSNMREQEEHKHIPVIVLTSRDTLFDKLKGKMSGTDEYVTKPFKPEVLLEKVEKYLG